MWWHPGSIASTESAYLHLVPLGTTVTSVTIKCDVDLLCNINHMIFDSLDGALCSGTWTASGTAYLHEQ